MDRQLSVNDPTSEPPDQARQVMGPKVVDGSDDLHLKESTRDGPRRVSEVARAERISAPDSPLFSGTVMPAALDSQDAEKPSRGNRMPTLPEAASTTGQDIGIGDSASPPGRSALPTIEKSGTAPPRGNFEGSTGIGEAPRTEMEIEGAGPRFLSPIVDLEDDEPADPSAVTECRKLQGKSRMGGEPKIHQEGIEETQGDGGQDLIKEQRSRIEAIEASIDEIREFSSELQVTMGTLETKLVDTLASELHVLAKGMFTSHTYPTTAAIKSSQPPGHDETGGGYMHHLPDAVVTAPHGSAPAMGRQTSPGGYGEGATPHVQGDESDGTRYSRDEDEDSGGEDDDGDLFGKADLAYMAPKAKAAVHCTKPEACPGWRSQAKEFYDAERAFGEKISTNPRPAFKSSPLWKQLADGTPVQLETSLLQTSMQSVLGKSEKSSDTSLANKQVPKITAATMTAQEWTSTRDQLRKPLDRLRVAEHALSAYHPPDPYDVKAYPSKTVFTSATELWRQLEHRVHDVLTAAATAPALAKLVALSVCKEHTFLGQTLVFGSLALAALDKRFYGGSPIVQVNSLNKEWRDLTMGKSETAADFISRVEALVNTLRVYGIYPDSAKS